MPKKRSKTVVGLRNRKERRITHVTTGAAAIAKIERRFDIVTMRRDGYSIQEIAEVLDLTGTKVRQEIQACLDYVIKETAENSEENRQLQIDRLDMLLKVYKPYATDSHKEERADEFGHVFVVEVPPDPKYAMLILQIEQRRAKLLALDIPETKKLDVTGVREYVGVDISQV